MNQNTDMTQVPDEVAEMEAIQKAALAEKVEAFGEALSKKRTEAVEGRTASGIEDDWTQDEEAYQGIDDANRDSVYKPASPNGSFQGKRGSINRSTVFLNITRPYVDAASARVADMLLPNDETNWDIRPTPIPEGNLTPVAQAAQQVATVSPVSQPEQATGQPIPAPAVDQMQQLKDQARAKAAKAKQQIEDWLVQCQWHSEVRKMVEDCARLGTGILKGPTPSKQFSRSATNDGGMISLRIEESIAPESRHIDPWNFYPDPACGEDLHSGAYVWEMDKITAKKLRELKDVPGYLNDQIDKVLEQGPNGMSKTNAGFKTSKVKVADTEKFEIWYFHGLAGREELEAAGVDIPMEGDVSVPAVITMVNDVVIKAALNPLDSGEFPYDMMQWQRRAGMPWGMGVARQINTPQRMLNAGTRNLMDNAAFTAGPQLVVRRGAIEPADGKWELTPRKMWFVVDGADVNAAKEAIMAINIPTMQEQLNNIIQFALKMAEDVTGLPMLMQGNQGQAPDTVGGMVIVNNNASVVLRRIIRTFDDRITEPHIRRYYEYLLMYGDDDEAKGDFQVDARGSTALIERDFQNNEAAQILQMSLNPAFGISPVKAMQEYLKSRRFDAKRFEPSEDEKQAAAQKQQPEDPTITAAKIRAESAEKIATTKGQVDLKKTSIVAEGVMHRTEVDTDRDLAYVQSQERRDQIAHEGKMAELQIRYALAQLEYANKNSMQLTDVKAQLAVEASRINLQRELATDARSAGSAKAGESQVVKPPIEPAGRAPDGQAFSR